MVVHVQDSEVVGRGARVDMQRLVRPTYVAKILVANERYALEGTQFRVFAQAKQKCLRFDMKQIRPTNYHKNCQPAFQG